MTVVISLSVNFQALVQKATMSKIMRQINQSYFEFFTLIGLRGLRGIKSKNGVSSIESVIFFMESLLEWLNKLFEPRSKSIP